MPFNSDDVSGIVYVWIGECSDAEDAKLAEEIANSLYNVCICTYISQYNDYFSYIVTSLPGISNVVVFSISRHSPFFH